MIWGGPISGIGNLHMLGLGQLQVFWKPISDTWTVSKGTQVAALLQFLLAKPVLAHHQLDLNQLGVLLSWMSQVNMVTVEF